MHLSCSKSCTRQGNNNSSNGHITNDSNAKDDQQDLNEDNHLACVSLTRLFVLFYYIYKLSVVVLGTVLFL